MFKLILLLRRKPGMSFADFHAYYENHHAPLGRSVMPRATRYLRRYLGAEDGSGEGAFFDVMTEVWFEDRAAYEQTMADIVNSDAAERLARDEEKLFDPSRTRMIVADERETLG